MRLAAALAGVLGLAALGGCDSADDRAAAYYERGQKLAAEGEPVKSLEFRNALKLREDLVESAFALGPVEGGKIISTPPYGCI